MIQAKEFVEAALARGYDFWSGVPCSILAPLINCVMERPDLHYLGASGEGEAVAIALGAYLGGRKTVVISQNSGLGNMVNPLTSLNRPFLIPTLLIFTHRGALGAADQPQHSFMGLITKELLDVLKIPWRNFPGQSMEVEAALSAADDYLARESLPYALIMERDRVAPCPPEKKTPAALFPRFNPRGDFSLPPRERMPRREAIALIKDALPANALVIGTTGKVSRELFALGHRANYFYVIGGMGCAAGIGLGLSLSVRDKKVVVLDGDGSVLMKMGSLATIGHYRPPNLIHVVLDNEAHESTGGQPTCSGNTDFAAIASACSYPLVWRCETPSALERAAGEALGASGPALIHVKVALGSDPHLPRPGLTPLQIKEQFMGSAIS